MFKNTYYGKPYMTRDKRKAIYLGGDRLEIEGERDWRQYYSNGNWFMSGQLSKYDIVSEWHEPIICKCQWKDYYDYRIMLPNGEGHIRVSFFQEEIIISDLFVAEEHRHKGYASILLDKVDELLAGKKAIIYPIEEWQNKWYKQRGYIIGKEDSIDEEKLDGLAYQMWIQANKDYAITDGINKSELQQIGFHTGFKAGYKQGWEDKK